jgi:regulator of sirC expression with transglutaminase-like and TPR domain
VREWIGEPAELWLREATNLEIVVRVLRNLKAAYAMEDHWTAVLPVQRRLVALLPDHRDEQRDLALIFLRSGQMAIDTTTP